MIYHQIISISKLLGNYNINSVPSLPIAIISISKLLGNYNNNRALKEYLQIISISKLLGNYNVGMYKLLNC